jgi:VWFA-related protein
MRKLWAATMLATALAGASGHAGQDTPRFRGGVDLITVDVAVLDSRGRPVDDLRAGDFVVKVDGRERSVVSAELIRVEREKSALPARPTDARISTNASVPHARRIVVAVDQTLIAPGTIRPLLTTASAFVSRLTADDHVAFIAFPEPGPRIDFTADTARIRRAMEGLVGHAVKRGDRQFDIGVSEAIALTGPERLRASSLPDPTAADYAQALLQPPTMRRILEGGCEGLTFDELRENLAVLERCRRLIFNESIMIAADARQDASISLRALEALLRDLALVDGPKTMVVISAGLVNDDPSVLDEVAPLAAAARTTINVVAVEPQREQEIRNNPRPNPAMSLGDRSLELQGLEIVADTTGGVLYRSPAGTSEGVFQRIESELSAWYLLAVERQPGDPSRQRVDVEVKRRGTTVRSQKRVIAAAAAIAGRSADELLSEALSSSIAVPGVPLRVATFAQRDTSPDRYRVRVAAQVGLPGEAPGEFTIGYALMNEDGRVVTTAGARRPLSPLASGPDQLLHYDTALSVEPGTYSLRFGVVDAAGRRGTVIHPVELPRLDAAELGTSDLIVGNLPAEGELLRPSVEPQVTASELAGYLDLYVPESDRDRVTVALEVAEGDASPALAAQPLSLRPGEQRGALVATGFVELTVTPGRYVARATIRRDGEVVKTVARPIAIVRDPRVVSTPPVRVRGVAMPADLRQRTAAYVAGVVNGIANVVAQEDFVLSRPSRTVTSDLLLVRYPGSARDLIPYRDVSHLDGAAVPGREERLLDLFVKPTDGLRERARRIMIGADAYVPSAFNPMFALGFLQSDFQSRFELTFSSADSEWPREVKVVTFVETGRPTLLRTGPFGDLDAPTRGMAWIEEGTGRILQTELEVGRGRSAPKMVTRFKLDERLQVTVPDTMRTENPEGVATYSNFRRFAVETETAIPAANPDRPE